MMLYYFNPRSPHGERLAQFNFYGQQSYISIHAPRTGSDHAPSPDPNNYKQFQSTLPARGATPSSSQSARTRSISIHAPRTGSDSSQPEPASSQQFQSTLPARGATVPAAPVYRDCKNFNPRSPHGERRGKYSDNSITDKISTHAPRTGSDYLADIVAQQCD